MIWELVFSILLWILFAAYSDMRRSLRLRRGRPPHRPPQGTERQPHLVHSGSSLPSQSPEDIFYPGLGDVLAVRNILRRLGPPEIGLPIEVVDVILDEAEYWPSVEAHLENPVVIRQDRDRECLRTPPLCHDVGGQSNDSAQSPPQVLPHRGIHPCRKIVFDISSHDQGWGGDRSLKGSYRGSYTWFDAYIVPSGSTGHQIQPEQQPASSERSAQHDNVNSTSTSEQANGNDLPVSEESFPPKIEFLPGPNKLLANRAAMITTQNHRVIWHYRDHIEPDSDEAARIEVNDGRGRSTLDGMAVREMCVGDSVSVWARARFMGWSNHIEAMTVRVYWAA